MPTILIVEDNADLRENMKWALSSSYSVAEADSIDSCVEAFKRASPDVVLLDMGLDNIPTAVLPLSTGSWC